MRAKEYMQQIEKLNKMIQNKQAELREWHSIATGTSSPTSGYKVQSSGSQDKMANAVCAYVDIEREINEDIAKLAEQRQEIVRTIEQLPTDEYDVLHKLYVQFQSIDDVAEFKNKSYSWVTTVHGRALKNVQRIIDKQK